jgi:hypothetical protein
VSERDRQRSRVVPPGPPRHTGGHSPPPRTFGTFTKSLTLDHATAGFVDEGVTGSIPVAPTIQSDQTADFQAESKQAVSAGVSAGIFLLFRSPVTLAVSQADFSLPSLHPKIPFPAVGFAAAKAVRELGNLGSLWHPKRKILLGPVLSRVQSEGFELLAPFGRSITKSLDSNAAWQMTFDRSAHEVRCEKCE